MSKKLLGRYPIGLGAMALATALVFAGCGGGADTPSEEGTGGDAAASEIKVLAVEGPETDSLEAESAKFAEESGVSVTVDKVARDVWGQRKVAELAQGAGNYDVVFLGGGDDSVWMVNHAQAKDLTEYLGEDIVSDIANKDLFTTEDGKLLGAPQYYNFPVTLYRQDLFNNADEQAAFEAKYGHELAAPKTFDELVEVAEFFNRPDEGLYGSCLGGVDWSVWLDDTYFVYGLGGNYGDLSSGELTLNSPEVVKSFEYISKLTQVSPPGWEEMTFFDCDNQMQSGAVAIYQNWLYAWRLLSDSMGDDIAMAPVAGSPTHLGSMLATIPESAPNPDGAGAFIKWMLGNDYQLAMSTATGNLPVLMSQLNDAEFAAALPELEMLQGVAGDLANVGVTWSGELSSGVSEAIAKVYRGEMTAQEAGDWLQNEKFKDRKALE